MAKAKKKASMLGIIMGIFVLGLCAMAIAGAFIEEWTVTTGEASFTDKTVELGSMSLEDYKDSVDIVKDSDVNWDAIKDAFEDAENNLTEVMVAFGYLTVALAIALVISYLLKMVLNFSLMRIITGLLGIATLVSGVVLVAVTASLCKDLSLAIGGIAATTTLGVAAYLTCIGAMAGGLCAVVGCGRK